MKRRAVKSPEGRPLSPLVRRIRGWQGVWPGGDDSILRRVPQFKDRDGWPYPPRLLTGSCRKVALQWLSMARSGQLHRFHEVFHQRMQMDGTSHYLDRPKSGRTQALALAAYGFALRWQIRSRAESGSFSLYIPGANARYLGDPSVVRELIDRHIALVLAAHQSEGRPNLYEDFSRSESELARIFAGLDPEFTPIGSWNTHAELGYYARKYLYSPSPVEDIVMVLEDSFYELRRCIARITARLQGSTSAVPNTETQYAIDVLAGFTTAVLLGLPVEDNLGQISQQLIAGPVSVPSPHSS